MSNVSFKFYSIFQKTIDPFMANKAGISV